MGKKTVFLAFFHCFPSMLMKCFRSLILVHKESRVNFEIKLSTFTTSNIYMLWVTMRKTIKSSLEAVLIKIPNHLLILYLFVIINLTTLGY